MDGPAFLVLSSAGLLLLSLSPQAAATNPLDDDAGSGKDAGDQPEEAIVIAAGSYQGNLTPPLDAQDYYSFPAEVESVLNLTFAVQDAVGILELQSSDGDVYGGLFPNTASTFVIPFTGVWRLHVMVNYLQYAKTPIPYAFTLDLGTLPHVEVFTPSSKSQAVEVEWDSSSFFAFHVWMSPQTNQTHPFATMTSTLFSYTNAGGAENPPGWIYTYRQTHLGHRVVVQPSPVPTQEFQGLPSAFYDAHERQFGSPWHGAAISCHDCNGSALLRAFRTGPEHSWIIALASTEPFRYASAQGDTVLTWSEANANSTVQVGVPGLAVTGDRQVSFNLNQNYILSFVPWEGTGSVTSPSGKRTDVSCPVSLVTCQAFGWPRQEEGGWTFRMNPRAAAGHGADEMYLVGAEFPSLGVLQSGSGASPETLAQSESGDPPNDRRGQADGKPQDAGNGRSPGGKLPGLHAWSGLVAAGLLVSLRRVLKS